MNSEIEKQIVKELDDRELTQEGLPPVLALYRQLVFIQSSARSRIENLAFRLNAETIDSRLKEGKPVFEFRDIPMDWVLYRELFNQVTAVFRSFPQFENSLSVDWKDDLKLLESRVEEWYRGHPSENHTGNPVTVEIMLQAALKPFLSIGSEIMLKIIDQDRWLRGYCPVCGGAADFAFLDRERGGRHLVCSRCDSQWLYKRLECHNCGNQDQNTLAYFASDSGLYRLYVCEKCRKYLKAIDLRCTEKQVLLPLERFMTMDLDRQACQKGYSAVLSI